MALTDDTNRWYYNVARHPERIFLREGSRQWHKCYIRNRSHTKRALTMTYFS